MNNLPPIGQELPKYVITGIFSENGYGERRYQSTLISCDRDHIQGMLESNKNWKSFSVFEIPEEPILDFTEDELLKYREDITNKANKKRRYELYLKLKAEFETNDKVNTEQVSSKKD